MGYLIGILIWALIWGFITKSVSKSKGYNGGFWWGFWLGFIGLIVVACKPDNRSYSSYSSALGLYAHEEENKRIEEENKRILASGGWKCANCNTCNPDYITTCQCGVSKSNNVPISKPKTKSEIKHEPEEKEPLSSVDEILKLKQLLDAGLLTQDEFDTKKKQLLGL
ncbi:MAG: SHOCT domain-containing protein [Ruminococcus sp.]|nr:SHOCT domain-containing protein [Ruminococcus sp.]MDE6848716.1 SHOCT domain-containing protein [Ruminococcus sp.]